MGEGGKGTEIMGGSEGLETMGGGVIGIRNHSWGNHGD